MLCRFDFSSYANIYVLRLLKPALLSAGSRSASSAVLKRASRPLGTRAKTQVRAAAVAPAVDRPQAQFKHLGLSQDLLTGLTEHKLLTPSEIQARASARVQLAIAFGGIHVLR